jgi:hypothetical protein
MPKQEVPVTTEQINEARNRPWADVEATGSGAEDGASTIERRHPRPTSGSARGRWAGWPVALLIAGAAIAVLVLAWGRRAGQLEVTVERKRGAF